MQRSDCVAGRARPIRRGECVTERHHILGKHVSAVTIDCPANLHRLLSDKQLEIPEEIKRYAPRDPLGWINRVLCAIRDFGQAVLDMLSFAIGFLRRLLDGLFERYGNRWTDEFGLPSRLA